jgi:hypothetical protein
MATSFLENLFMSDAQRNDAHMGKVFAANPAFGQMLYGAKNDAAVTNMAMEDFQRKRQQQEALKALASKLGTANLKDPMQRQSALAQYGQVTGDLDPMFGIGQNVPSAIQEYQFFQNLSPQDQATYLSTKRANQMFDRGGSQVVLDPTGSVVTEIGKTLAPADVPANAAEKTAAEEEAKLRQQLGLEPQIAEATKRAELGVEKGAELPKAKAKLNATLAKSKNVTDTIDRALLKVGPTTAGLGSVVAGVPSSEAKDLSADLKTIKANLGFDELQEMRQNSPTGGALGQVAVQEIEFLQSIIASLDQSQSPEQLKQNLLLAKKAKMESDERIRAAFEADYGQYMKNTAESVPLSTEDLGNGDALPAVAPKLMGGWGIERID